MPVSLPLPANAQWLGRSLSLAARTFSRPAGEAGCRRAVQESDVLLLLPRARALLPSHSCGCRARKTCTGDFLLLTGRRQLCETRLHAGPACIGLGCGAAYSQRRAGRTGWQHCRRCACCCLSTRLLSAATLAGVAQLGAACAAAVHIVRVIVPATAAAAAMRAECCAHAVAHIGAPEPPDCRGY